MDVGIVGASGAGLYAALFLSKKHPDWKVALYDGNDKIGKKLLATGNGHCNLLPKTLNSEAYRYPALFQVFLGGRSIVNLLDALDDIGVSTCRVHDLYYPESYSAAAHVEFLRKQLIAHHVELKLSTKIKGFDVDERVILHGERENFIHDYVFFAHGGVSQPNLGSDGSLDQAFIEHGYHLVPKHPGLAPIKTKESTKKLSGIRHVANCRLIVNQKIIHEESGEILFKKDGLSGICIFNLESYWVRLGAPLNATIEIDLFPDESLESLKGRLEKKQSQFGDSYLDAVFVDALKDYLLVASSRFEGKSEPERIANAAKHLVFHPVEPYPFAESQVTVGGISLEEVDDSMRSKRHENIFILGEALDMDGLCGGNNLAWCLLCALKAVEALG